MIRRLRDLQARDQLTGLLTRQSFLLSAQHLIATAHGNQQCGLVLLDIDRFRSINDTLGHRAGDQLLMMVADRLRKCLRTDLRHHGRRRRRSRRRPQVRSPLIARMGGDDFAVFLPRLHDSTTLDRIVGNLVAEVSQPVRLDGTLVATEVSVGVCIYPGQADGIESLVRHADIAMGRAQRDRSGQNSYDDRHHVRPPFWAGVLAELQHGLAAGDFELHYQPQVSCDGRVIGLEGLLRWNKPATGVDRPSISTDHFIAALEESSIALGLSDHVLETAITQLSVWRTRGIHLPVAINVPPLDLQSSAFSEKVEKCLLRNGIPAELLQIEITERQLVEHPRQVATTLTALRNLGVRISLDDFGTGNSSLARLLSFPVDEIKIDRSFISRLTSDRHYASVVRSLIGLAHSLKVSIVAEGVEDRETWRRLHSMGVDAIQGWVVSPALPPEQATVWLIENSSGLHGSFCLRP